jgi:PhnB protein
MQTRLNPYLSFKDNARQAMEFYQSVFGGNLNISTFKEFQASQDPSEDNKVMHAVLEVSDSMVLMGADTPNSMDFSASNCSVSLSGDNEAELSGYYNKLADGGQVTMPLDKAPWGDTFGMCTDKFGVNWLVNVSPAK